MKRVFAYIILSILFFTSEQQTFSQTMTEQPLMEDGLSVPGHQSINDTPPLTSGNDDDQDCISAWDNANRAYIDGDYQKALSLYQSVIGYNRYSAKLYYNLANAYFKTGKIGYAILYYNKALQLSPNDDDIRYNISIAEAQTKDKIETVPEFFINRWSRNIRNTMSCLGWSVLSLIMFASTLLFAVFFILFQRITIRKIGFFGSIISLFVFIVATSFAIAERHDITQREYAIVTSSAISIKSSPDNSATDIFVLHEGTKVRIISEMNNWYEIIIADGKKGWTEINNIEQI